MTKLANVAAVFCFPIFCGLTLIAYGLDFAPYRDNSAHNVSRLDPEDAYGRAIAPDRGLIIHLAEVIAKQQEEIRTTHEELAQLRKDATAAIGGLLREIEKLERQPGSKPSKLSADTLPTDF